MQHVPITTPYITLGALLKLAGIVSTGGEVKPFLAEAEVIVNGESENRRGRKLYPGDVLEIDGNQVCVDGVLDDGSV